jgi:hypothetical protein
MVAFYQMLGTLTAFSPLIIGHLVEAKTKSAFYGNLTTVVGFALLGVLMFYL